MSESPSELVELWKLNGNFKANYGKVIGAYLYLRSVSATRRPFVFLEYRAVRALFNRTGLVGETWLAWSARFMIHRKRIMLGAVAKQTMAPFEARNPKKEFPL